MTNKVLDKDLLKVVKEENKNKGLNKHDMDIRLAKWRIFYLNNLDLFVEDVLGIKLRFFQKQLLLDMREAETDDIIASRGLSKSFVTSIFAISMGLLLPNYNMLITSFTLSQSNIIINEKIDKLLSSPNGGLSPTLAQLRKEGYIEFKKNRETSSMYCELGNGSKIFAVNCGESARGLRSNCVIVDEACLIKKTDYDSIIEPTLEPYQYGGIFLESKQLFLTSSKNVDNWVYRHLCKAVHDHYKGKTERKFFAGDIFTAVANKVQTPKQYYSRRENTDPYSFETEYLNIWAGEAKDALFKRQDFINAQTLRCTYYPPTPFYKPQINRNPKEVRFLALDLALSGGQQNDLTIVDYCICNIETGNCRIEYIESFSGMNTNEQVKRFKRSFYDFEAEYLVFDSKGLGLGIYDVMTAETYDDERDITYKGWTVISDPQLLMCSQTVLQDKIQRTVDNNAEQVLIPFVGTTESNSDIFYNLWSYLRNKKLELLQDAYTMEFTLQSEDPMFITKDSEEKADILIPYKQTDLMINEACTLDITRNDRNMIKVSEKSGSLKDRFMCLAYACAFANKLYNKYQGCYGDDDDDYDLSDYDFGLN